MAQKKKTIPARKKLAAKKKPAAKAVKAASPALEKVRIENARLRELMHAAKEAQMALQEKVALLTQENQQTQERVAVVERQTAYLTALYVATHQLNEATDRKALLAALQDIVCNIIGSEEHAILEKIPGQRRLRAIASMGIEPSKIAEIELADGIIGQAAAEGRLFVAPNSVPAAAPLPLTACVPLRVGNDVVGVIAIFRLLAHKAQLEPLDYELFNMLTTQGAFALRFGVPMPAAAVGPA